MFAWMVVVEVVIGKPLGWSISLAFLFTEWHSIAGAHLKIYILYKFALLCLVGVGGWGNSVTRTMMCTITE